jgi:hypothetical protein
MGESAHTYVKYFRFENSNFFFFKTLLFKYLFTTNELKKIGELNQKKIII